jgi:hypothetical protein
VTQRVSEAGPPGRAEATQGVEERLATTVHAYPGLLVIPIPAQFLRVPETAGPPGAPAGLRSGAYPGSPGPRLPEPPGLSLPALAAFFGGGGQRVLRGGRLPGLGDGAGEVFDVVRDVWDDAGSRVDDVTGLDGRMLVVHDPEDYLIILTWHGDDDPILTVASPPLASPFIERGLLAGLLSGLALGCLGPCFASVGPMAAFPSLAGLSAPYWGWVPLFALITGVTLWRPETRRFGAGLLLSGAIVGFTVAGVVGG